MGDAKTLLAFAFNVIALFNFLVTLRQLHWLHVSTKRLFTPMTRGPSKHTLRFVIFGLIRTNAMVSITIFAGVFALSITSKTSIFNPQIVFTLAITSLSLLFVVISGLKFWLDSRKFT